MSKIIITFILAFIFISANAQIEIKKTTNIATYNGVKCYQHVVEPKQTLYSICHAYGVNIDEICAFNGKADKSISISEVINIPYSESDTHITPPVSTQQSDDDPIKFISINDEFYSYSVKESETLYRIAVKFELKVNRLLKYNPQYKLDPIHVGDIILIPVTKITLPLIHADQKANKKVIKK